MTTRLFALVLGTTVLLASPGQGFVGHHSLKRVQRHLAGSIVDHTSNHGRDRRIWSNALCEKRDLYVYLPPCFDVDKRYPLMIWMHGIDTDEKGFLSQALPDIDQAMACGKLPPFIIAIPDGTLRGHPGWFQSHSGFINSRAGAFGDYLVQDVYGFLVNNYPIRPEREAHVLGGVSLGGAAAFHHAIKHKDHFGVAVGVFPPLNLRWLDCHGRYFGKFDPGCWGWRTNYHLGLESVGKFYGGLVRVPFCRLVHPLYGHGPKVVAQISRDNPIELLENSGLKDGDVAMLVASVGRDEFNIDAQVDSFLYRAHQLGLGVDLLYNAKGRHNLASARSFLPEIEDWISQRLAPYNPGGRQPRGD